MKNRCRGVISEGSVTRLLGSSAIGNPRARGWTFHAVILKTALNRENKPLREGPMEDNPLDRVLRVVGM